MRYRYRAVDAAGRLHRGCLPAGGPAELAARLDRHGLALLSARRETRRQRPLPRRELIHFSFHLSHLLHAGVPLLDCLADLADSLARGPLQAACQALHDDIAGGRNLADGLASQAPLFPAVYVQLVRAGEHSGRLPEVLDKLLQSLRWQDQFASQTRRLLGYPLLLAAVLAGLLGFVLGWLLPRLAGFMQSMQLELPWHTRLLLSLSEQLLNHPLASLGLLASPALLWPLWRLADPAHLHHRDQLLLRLPWLGPLLKQIALARFADHFALLYAAGIPLLDCLGLLEHSLGNQALLSALQRARRDIGQGQGIAASFAAAGLFPPLLIRMLRIGEQSGALDRALSNISHFYQRDIEEATARAQTLIEPVSTVILGLVLGSVMLSVLGPLYDLLGKLPY